MSALASPRALNPPSTKEPNTFVRRLAGLVPLTMEDLLAVSRLTARVRPVPAGIDLIQPDEPHEHAIVVLDGFACTYKLRQNGKRQNLAFLLPGDVSDFDGLLLTGAAQSLGTLSPCMVAQVPGADLLDVMKNHPRVARALRSAKVVDAAITREWLMMLGSYSAPERLAHLFCEFLARLKVTGLVQDGNSYSLPVSQSVLGETLGLSSVHVNRSLQILRQEGWITLRSGRLHIHDVERLTDYAEFNPGYLRASLI